jgi:hypothetical protein
MLASQPPECRVQKVRLASHSPVTRSSIPRTTIIGKNAKSDNAVVNNATGGWQEPVQEHLRTPRSCDDGWCYSDELQTDRTLVARLLMLLMHCFDWSPRAIEEVHGDAVIDNTAELSVNWLLIQQLLDIVDLHPCHLPTSWTWRQ